MISEPNGKPGLSVKGIVVLSLLGAVMFTAKMAMAWLPNIEPVSLLVMVYTVVFGRRALYPIYIYVAMECLIWGVNFWSIAYLYVWALLALFAWLFRNMRSHIGWAVLSGGFGLCFGALNALVYLVAGGPAFALSWWIAGIPFDALHCAGNFVMALALFHPCRRVLVKLSRQVGLLEAENGGT